MVNFDPPAALAASDSAAGPLGAQISHSCSMIAHNDDKFLTAVKTLAVQHALVVPKIGGTNALMVPEPQKLGGTCPLQSPWWLRLC